MTRTKMKGFACLLLLFMLFSKFTQAQFVFHQSFSQPGTLSKPGWMLNSPNQTTTIDTVNGFTLPGSGAVKVSFFNMRGGSDIDSLITPVFTTPTSSGDTLYFEHAHVMKLFSSGIDSMHIMISTNGGATYSLLNRYEANPFATIGTLSTVTQPTFGFFPVEFVPGGGDWRSEVLQLPAGINRLAFVFFAGGGNSLYLDNIKVGKTPTTCTGNPGIGNIGTTILSCVGKQFVISPDSFELNPYVTYQWKQSQDSGATFPWVNVTGAIGTTSPELFKNHLTNMYYRLEATCSSSSLATITSGVHVLNDSFYNCYCNTNLGGTCDPMFGTPDIINFKFPLGTLDNSSWCTGNAASSYTRFPIAAGSFDSIPAGHPLFPVEVNIDENLANAALWIDYNRNGMFDSTEYYDIANSFTARAPGVAKLHIPALTTGGLTGIRLRVYETSSLPVLDSNDACTFNNTGETEDYYVYIKPAPICNGAPQTGTLSQTAFHICAGDKIKLVSSGYTYGAGITYSWEESDDNGTLDPWSAVSASGATGINSPEFFSSAINDTIYYRLRVNCSSTNSTSYSSVVSVYTKPFYECYCQSNIGGAGCDPRNPYISNVTLSGTSINNTTLCSNNSENYSYFGLATNAHDSVIKGQQLTLSVTTRTDHTSIGAWIDYDKDSIFESNEFLSISAYNLIDSTARLTFIIPDTSLVLTGYTGMRIRAAGPSFTMSDRDACSLFNEGETEDYVLFIEPATGCTGAPTAGALPDTLRVCLGDSILVSSLGSSYGGGMTYSWEESDDRGNTDPWTAVTSGSGFNTRNFMTSALTDTIYYRLRVTCTNSSSSVISDTLAVFIKPFYECYCNNQMGGGAGSACSSGNYISNVSVQGGNLNNNSGCHLNSTNGNYSKFLPAGTATDSLFAGGYYTISAQTNSNNDAMAVWIDYNHNGSFDANEHQMITVSTVSGMPSAVSFIIPSGALSGYTGMRVKSDCNSCPSINATEACSPMSFGETEDYIIYIKPAPVCSGTPTAASIGSNTLVCKATPFQLTSPSSTFGNGIVYQWEESDDNGTFDPWANVAGAANRTDTTRMFTSTGITQPKYFRLSVTCQNSTQTAHSNSIMATIDSFYNCYTPTAQFGGGSCANNTHIEEVTIQRTDLGNSSGCNTSAVNGVYTKFPASGRSTGTLVRNTVYQMEVRPSGFMSQNVGMWIDYNRNGSFETSEFTNLGNGSMSSPASGSIVTATAPGVTGLTGMRIRSRVSGFTMIQVAPTDTTANYADGEVEDYVIMLDTLRPATGTVVTTISNTEATISWNRGNGNTVLVVARPSSAAAVAPANSVFYRTDNSMNPFAGDSTGFANYAVYTGTDTFTTVINMDPLTAYSFNVYEAIDNGVAGIYYSIVADTTSGTTLPVKLINFTAQPDINHVTLNWSTAGEINNKGFVIERSADGRRFTEAGFVKGNNTSNVLNHYSFVDMNAFEAGGSHKLYYRLKQVDFDNRFSYSNIVIAIRGIQSQGGLSLSPNPFSQQLIIRSTIPFTRLHVMISDISGRMVVEKDYLSDSGVGAVEIKEAAYLQPGLYFVRVNDGVAEQTLRLIKQ